MSFLIRSTPARIAPEAGRLAPSAAPVAVAVVVSTLLIALSACTGTGEQGTTVTTSEKFGQDPGLETLDPDPWRGTASISEKAHAEVMTNDGRMVALWIDPEDTSRVLAQRSTLDQETWNKPTVLAQAGDTCLVLEAATDGERIAGTLQCYETNGAIDQAPDQAYAVVSTDNGATWLRHSYPELTPAPTFTRDLVVWSMALTWSEDEGFVDQS